MLEEVGTLMPPHETNLRLLLKMEVLRSTIKVIQMGKERCRITEYEKSMQKEIKAFAKGLTAACEQSNGRKMTPKEIKQIWDFAESFMLLQGKPED